MGGSRDLCDLCVFDEKMIKNIKLLSNTMVSLFMENGIFVNMLWVTNFPDMHPDSANLPILRFERAKRDFLVCQTKPSMV